jgi:hypothetical protein
MDKPFKFFLSFLILLAFLPYPVSGLGQGGPAQASTPLLNNDSIVKLVKAEMGEEAIISIVRTQPGKYSLGVDDIIALKKAGVSEKTITAMAEVSTKGTASTLPAIAAPSVNGRVKGTLTFWFNSNYGTKPDVGAEVVLVRGFLGPIPDDAVVPLESMATTPGDATKLAYHIVAHSVADGNGNFELTDIPPGEYTIVMQSNHPRGKYVSVVVTTDKKGNPLKKPKTNQILTKRDMFGVVFSSHVFVEAGKTEDRSHDCTRPVNPSFAV